MSGSSNNGNSGVVKRKLVVVEEVDDTPVVEEVKRKKLNVVPPSPVASTSAAASSNELMVYEKTLLDDMDKYSAEVDVKDDESDDETKNTLAELKKISHISGDYAPQSYCLMEVPMDKYKPYNTFTSLLGYTFNKENNFLRNGGVMSLLQQERPFFCFWEHGLELLFPRTECNFQRKVKVLLKRTHCAEHEFQCPFNRTSPTPCRTIVSYEDGASATFIVSGYLRCRKVNINTKTFTSYSIELENAHRIIASKFNVSDQLTIKATRMNVHLIRSCSHKECGVGVSEAPFEGMLPIYRMCNRVETVTEIKDDYNMARCYAYGRGIQGSYFGANNTIYLATWVITDLYIVVGK